jgi:isopenicillin N synthase-like dioxygenase
MTGLQCFTILWQQPGIQALQVLNTSGEWIDAPSIPGTLVIKYVLYILSFVFVTHEISILV